MIWALTYFLTLLISLLGLGAGVLLAFLTPEELEPNRRYILLAKKALMGALMGIVGLIYSGSYGVCALFSALGFGLGWFIHDEKTLYLLLGGMFFVGSLSDSLFPLVGVLVMGYGFCAGTLLTQMHAKRKGVERHGLAKRIILIGIIYSACAAALFYLKQLVQP